ncbi:uncharacterized protein LOC108605438 [Drosophila busckii]|uniref:uncharacterized protein LOC108605438 n=1 Tax=Drosophila busckii TaxID=30019 RepID=UPI00083EC341|nr:uncharacterized protein LOC108605438 [Drosophila busckii]
MKRRSSDNYSVWDGVTTIQLIKTYEEHELLWNSKHRQYVHRDSRTEAWAAMAKTMQMSVPEVKRKLNSLLGVFHSQQRKNVSMPRWWTKYLSFLVDNKTEDHGSAADGMPRSIDPAYKSDDCDSNVYVDGAESDADEPSESGSNKGKHKSAFEEFLAEYEAPKRIVIQEANSSTAISLEPKSGDSNDAEPTPQPSPITQQVDDEDMQLYCKYLCSKLSKYSSSTRSTIQYHFNRILYEADMGWYEESSSSGSSKQ